MMRHLLISFVIVFLSVLPAFSQCDEVAQLSEQFFSPDFLSDGQTYRALLFEDQTAEFTTLFFGGTTYRLSASTGLENGITFQVLDQNRNVLFSNTDFDKVPYWDFEVENTINCTIEAQLDPSVQSSGCAVILIGFKE